MATATKAATLSDQDLAELIALTKGADSVELKLTVPVSERSRGAAALGVDPLDGQIRQVYFFDTPDLTLNKAGVVVRARRVQQRATTPS
jgi:inorganic triphosphatase YgiF